MTKQGFWDSFEQLIPELEQLISGQKKSYAPYNALSETLRQFNEYLIPEITKDKEGHYILIISCDGYERGIPAVEELTADIKDYPNWIIVRYRQPGPMEWIPFKGQNVRRKNPFFEKRVRSIADPRYEKLGREEGGRIVSRRYGSKADYAKGIC